MRGNTCYLIITSDVNVFNINYHVIKAGVNMNKIDINLFLNALILIYFKKFFKYIDINLFNPLKCSVLYMTML